MAHVACDGEFLLLLSFIYLFIPHRVRCDLKDLNYIVAGPTPSCSNCTERNIKCVYVILLSPHPFALTLHFRDEFADVKAVKLLRRGRRLQQVE